MLLLPLVIGACAVVGALTCGLAVVMTTSLIAPVIVLLALTGFAFGAVQPGLVAVAGRGMSQRDFGLAASLQQTGVQVGSVLGIGLFAAIGADATTDGPFVAAFLLSGGLFFLGTLLATRLHRGDPSLRELPGRIALVRPDPAATWD